MLSHHKCSLAIKRDLLKRPVSIKRDLQKRPISIKRDLYQSKETYINLLWVSSSAVTALLLIPRSFQGSKRKDKMPMVFTNISIRTENRESKSIYIHVSFDWGWFLWQVYFDWYGSLLWVSFWYINQTRRMYITFFTIVCRHLSFDWDWYLL